MPPSRRLDADRLAAAYERDDAVGAARRPRPGGRRRRRPGRGRWLVPPKPAAPPRGEHRGAGRAAPSNCRAAGKRPGSAPPSDALKRAFGILRRERTGDEAPPAPALKAIERRGWEVVDPSATRLLRADRRARAWVVPAPDVAPMPSIVGRGAAASVRDQARTRARARARGRARGRAGGPPRSWRRPSRARGLVVASVGRAPGGGGGALRIYSPGSRRRPSTRAPARTATWPASPGWLPTASRPCSSSRPTAVRRGPSARQRLRLRAPARPAPTRAISSERPPAARRTCSRCPRWPCSPTSADAAPTALGTP